MRRRLRRLLLLGLAAPLLGGAALALLFYAAQLPPLPAPPQEDFELQDVVLVTPGRGRQGPATLAVRGGRIASIGPPRAAPAGPPRHVLPGLIDSHVHSPLLPGDEPLHAALYLLHGVTSVRNLGDGYQSLRRKREVAGGRRGGPRLFTCGVHLDGPPAPLIARELRTPAEGRAAVEDLQRRGADCVKVFSQLDPATYEALRDAAQRAALPVVGHMISSVGILGARMDDVQHLTGVPDAPSPSFGEEQFDRWFAAWDQVDEPRLDRVIAAARRDGAVHTPTLVGQAYRARGAGGALRPPLGLVPAWYAEVWRTLDAAVPPPRRELARRSLPRLLHAAARLHRGGVPLQAGSDSFLFMPYVAPGAGLHDELRLLVEAGLTPEEALAAATTTPGARLRLPGLGTLTVGAPADLAVFREDPSRSLDHLASLEEVIVDGRRYRCAALQAQLRRQLAAAARFPSSLAGRLMRFFIALWT